MKVLHLLGGQAEGSASISKALGSLIFRSTAKWGFLNTELINLQIERQNGSNIEITEGFVPLKPFLAAATYGSDAITAFKDFDNQVWETVAVVELAEHGHVEMGPQDRLIVSLKGLSSTYKYAIDGHEEPMPSKEIYEYRRRTIPADQSTYDVDVDNFDIMVLPLDPNWQELNFTHDNGTVTKHEWPELIAMSQDLDPVAIVAYDGTVSSGLGSLLQFPVADIRTVNVRKIGNSASFIMLRKDVDIAQAANF